MKPDFFVARATSKTFKIFCLYSQGHLTFRQNPIIQIAAKFQYKIPPLRTLAVIWTLSHSLEVFRKERVLLSYKDLKAVRPQLMWTLSSALTSEIGTENRSVECYYYNYLYIIWLLLLLLLWSMMIFIIGFTCPPTIHFKFITKCNSLFYYKVRQLFYYKVRQVLLQSATILLQSATEQTVL